MLYGEDVRPSQDTLRPGLAGVGEEVSPASTGVDSGSPMYAISLIETYGRCCRGISDVIRRGITSAADLEGRSICEAGSGLLKGARKGDTRLWQ